MNVARAGNITNADGSSELIRQEESLSLVERCPLMLNLSTVHSNEIHLLLRPTYLAQPCYISLLH